MEEATKKAKEAIDVMRKEAALNDEVIDRKNLNFQYYEDTRKILHQIFDSSLKRKIRPDLSRAKKMMSI